MNLINLKTHAFNTPIPLSTLNTNISELKYNTVYNNCLVFFSKEEYEPNKYRLRTIITRITDEPDTFPDIITTKTIIQTLGFANIKTLKKKVIQNGFEIIESLE